MIGGGLKIHEWWIFKHFHPSVFSEVPLSSPSPAQHEFSRSLKQAGWATSPWRPRARPAQRPPCSASGRVRAPASLRLAAPACGGGAAANCRCRSWWVLRPRWPRCDAARLFVDREVTHYTTRHIHLFNRSTQMYNALFVVLKSLGEAQHKILFSQNLYKRSPPFSR